MKTTEKESKKAVLDEATLGPVRYLMSGIKNSVVGLFSMLKTPKMLLPMIIISLFWVALSYLKLRMPESKVIFGLSLLTFAQGGMYAGLLGAAGGILGKAFLSWFVTTALMPVLSKSKRTKTVKMKIGPSFAVKSIRGFALFISGIGIALVAYNFMTGNGTLENSIIGLMAFMACFRALRNPKSFMIGLLRSFTKGRLSRAKAGHFVVGLMIGFICGIASSTVVMGGWCYILGALLVLVALILGMLGKGRKTVAVSMAIIILSLFMMPLTQTKAESEWMDPYEAYGVNAGDFDALMAAIEEKPFYGIKLQPLGMVIGTYYQVLTTHPELTVVVGKGTKYPLNVTTPSLEDLHNKTEYYSYLSARFEGGANLFFDDNRQLVMESSGKYQGQVINRTDYGDGQQPLTFNANADLGVNSAELLSYGDLKEACISDGEYALFGESVFSIDPATLCVAINLSTSNEMRWSDGDITDDDVEGGLNFKVNAVMVNPPTGKTEKVGTYWVLDEVYIDDTHEDGYFYYEVEDGRIFESYGEPGDESYNATEYTWSRPPERIELGREGDVKITKRITWLGNQYTSRAGYMLGNAYISAALNGSQDYEIVYEAYFGKEGEEPTSITLYGNNLNPGESVEANYILYQATFRTESTVPYSELTTENSKFFIDIHAFGAGGVVYIYKLSTDAVYGETTPKNVADKEAIDSEIDDSSDMGNGFETIGPFNIEWEERTNEEDTGIVNAVSLVSALIGAGAAVAGGFGGFRGPKGKGLDYDPEDGTLVVTGPNGSQEIYKLNTKTGDFEHESGSVLNVDDIDRAQREQAIDQALIKADIEKMREGSDGDSNYWQKVNRMQHLKEKLENSNSEGEDDLAQHMAERLERIQRDINSGKGLDEKGYNAVKGAYGKYTRGEIADRRSIPGEYTKWEQYKDAISLSAEEIARGESGKAIALRIVVGIGTGMKSEYGFEIAKSVYTTKDYVDAGGNEWHEAVGKAALNTIVDEGIGRAVGLGFTAIGKVGSFTVKIASKTNVGKVLVAKGANLIVKMSDFMGTNVGDIAKKIMGSGAKQADEAAKALKVLNASKAAQAIKSANKNLDDAIKSTTKESEKLGKAVGEQADDLAKSKAARYEEAQRKWKSDTEAAEKAAEDEIAKYRKAADKTRDELYRKGEQIGSGKIDNLKAAQDRLNRNPGSQEAIDGYDEALRAVQQDKFAMKRINNINDKTANEIRGTFNTRNEQYTQAALKNTKERLAIERNVDVEKIKFVEASNTGGTPRVADAPRTAPKVAKESYTPADLKGVSSADDIIPSSTRIKGAPKDKDVTGRILDNKTNEWVDIPKEDVERIYQQELYKVHNKGNLPKAADGSVDDKVIKEFAEKMDHTVTDRTGKDAYGTKDADLISITNKNSMDVKEFDDITSISGTMEYKSNEWFERADKLRDQAAKSKGSAAEELLIQAEGQQAEGVRQLVKQFDSQVADQLNAVAATGKNVQVGDKLRKAIRVLDQLDKEGGLSMAEAEAVLKGMNTSIEDVVQQSSALMEAIGKFN